MNFKLKIWRQASADAPGQMVDYDATEISEDMSFLEMLDLVNERMAEKGEEPVAFASDCREGICGTCGVVINGVAHGPMRATATCQLFMRHFQDGQTIYVEPWRAEAFPIVKDLVCNRDSMERIQQAGGYISVNTGNAPDAHAVPVPKDASEAALNAAECIGCGACVAACKNASAMLFLAAKVSHLSLLPQGQPEREERTLAMLAAHDDAGFGACTNYSECQAVCPKDISVAFIARLNREVTRSRFKTTV